MGLKKIRRLEREKNHLLEQVSNRDYWLNFHVEKVKHLEKVIAFKDFELKAQCKISKDLRKSLANEICDKIDAEFKAFQIWEKKPISKEMGFVRRFFKREKNETHKS